MTSFELGRKDEKGGMLSSSTSDVLAITKDGQGWIVRCQTNGPDRLSVFNGLSGKV